MNTQNYQNRLAKVAGHVISEYNPNKSVTGFPTKNMDDVVIVTALRTPMTRARKGKLKDTSADELVKHVLKGVLVNSKINPADVGDIVFGSVLGPSSQRANELRIGAFMAGFPETVPVHTVNRQCSSGLQAIASVAACAPWHPVDHCLRARDAVAVPGPAAFGSNLPFRATAMKVW